MLGKTFLLVNVREEINMAWCIPKDCLALLSTNFDALARGRKPKSFGVAWCRQCYGVFGWSIIEEFSMLTRGVGMFTSVIEQLCGPLWLLSLRMWRMLPLRRDLKAAIMWFESRASIVLCFFCVLLFAVCFSFKALVCVVLGLVDFLSTCTFPVLIWIYEVSFQKIK